MLPSGPMTVIISKIVPLADVEVGRVVAGGDFERPGAEFQADRMVRHDGDAAAHDGQHGPASLQRQVAGVFGVHRHAGVAQHGLRPDGGDGDVLRLSGGGVF